MVKVIPALAKGMCFGVRDAIEATLRRDDADQITIRGELVHNAVVTDGLLTRGFRMSREDDRGGLPPTPKVLVTAHGISDRERSRLESAGKEVIDTTCPLVRRVHEIARRLETDGYLVVVIGKPGHVEVLGITGDLHGARVVSDVADVVALGSARIGVVAQTTFPIARARAIVAAIRQANAGAEVRFLDTVCDPTKQRVLALESLLPRVDAVVVVGGHNSNNTKELVRIAESAGVPAAHVADETEIDSAWCLGFDVVGLTAGTSTLDWTIARVHHALISLGGSADDVDLDGVARERDRLDRRKGEGELLAEQRE